MAIRRHLVILCGGHPPCDAPIPFLAVCHKPAEAAPGEPRAGKGLSRPERPVHLDAIGAMALNSPAPHSGQPDESSGWEKTAEAHQVMIHLARLLP